MRCINLKEEFGNVYRVIVGPEHLAERGTQVKRVVDPWHCQIPAAARFKAHVYPWSDTRFAVSRDFKVGNKINQELLALPTARLEQDGDDGVTISFERSDFEAVSSRLELLRRKVLTDEQRARLAERAKRNFGRAA